MQVFKFGGASIKDVAAIRNVTQILKSFLGERIVIIISAMGKTTNALETITDAYFNQTGKAPELLNTLKQQHYDIAAELFGTRNHPIFAEMDKHFSQIEQFFPQPPRAAHKFVYDQMVSVGELVSTVLVSAYLNEQGVGNTWLDVRRCVKTDNTYREANVNWEFTTSQIQKIVLPLLDEGKFVLTQGFLGGTIEYFTTTLGREGSDYTAAIFSNVLDAEQMTVWKDVPGILNADPRLIKDTVLLSKISYLEAVEMTYYGAQVIHPKTIKPLQNKRIPLRVRSFEQPDIPGTVIHTENLPDMPPIIVIKKNQLLLKVQSKDFSFMAEDNLSAIYAFFANHHVKTNLTQNAAISFSACIDYVPYKVEPLLADLREHYQVTLTDGLELYTIRHYTPEAIAKYTDGFDILLEQKAEQTVQMALK